jgi:hypothetical protein
LQRELPGLYIRGELMEAVESALRRHGLSMDDCEVIELLSDGDGGFMASRDLAQVSRQQGVVAPPLSGLDGLLRKVFPPAQYELYFKGFVADRQRKIWEARLGGDSAAEIREYVWVVIDLARLVPAWIWALVLKAVIGIMSRP